MNLEKLKQHSVATGNGSVIETQALGAAPGIEPGTSRTLTLQHYKGDVCANGGANDPPLAHSLAHPLASLTHSLETLGHLLAPLAIR